VVLWHRKGACGSEREEEREMPEFYTAREKGKGKWKGAVAGGLP
jgi:hypothetical protein